MNLDLALASVRGLSPLVLPELTRLTAAKKRVLERWPDIVPDPPETDHNAIISQMLAILQSDNWDGVKMSFVLRSLKVAFNSHFRTREEVAPIITFAFDELDATSHSTFLNGIAAIYLASYEPKADHSLTLGDKITAKRDLLSAKWRAIESVYPTLFNASCAHDDIAASMEEMDEPWPGLKANGFANPHATGLMDYVHETYVDRIRHKLHMESWLDCLFKLLHPEPGKRKLSGASKVIEAVLGHWLTRTASEQTRQTVTEHLINQYNDPRTTRTHWLGVGEDYMGVIYGWLTREDLRFFTSVVDATQKDPQWQPRKKFWLQLFEEGKIEQAWVAFCPSAERYARTHLIRSGFADSVRRFGRQTKGGGRFDTSILIMKIRDKIVVDGCHNYRTHIFNYDDPVAPKLFKRDYDCDDDVMRISPESKAHTNPIYHWENWVRATIDNRIPMSPYRPARQSPARSNDQDILSSPTPQSVQRFHAPSSVQALSTQPVQQRLHNPPSDAARPAITETPAIKPKRLPAQQLEPTAIQTSTSKVKTNDASQAVIPSSTLLTEIDDLTNRIRGVGDHNQAIKMILRKVAGRQTLNSEERKIFANCIAKHRRRLDDLKALSAYLMPIFDRTMTTGERSKWKKAAHRLRKLADQYGLSSFNSESALRKLSDGELLSKSETNAMEYLAQRLRSQGVEVLDLISRE